jgi:hypothetical protein
MRCGADGCTESAIFHISWVESRRCKLEQHLCENHASPILTSLKFDRQAGAENSAAVEGARCFDICLIVISEIHEQQVVYLQEIGSDRAIPIIIGIFEATALDRKVKGLRPLGL